MPVKFRQTLAQLMSQSASHPYQTNLSPQEQVLFSSWADRNNAPVDLTAQSDYDMPGYFKGLLVGEQSGPRVSEVDDRPHYTDQYKTPYHRSFSGESQYAKPNGPKWVGNKLVDSEGNVIHVDLPE